MSSENNTDTKTDNNTQVANDTAPAQNENKVIFGPLGKYAAIAVIMVSLIVTSAIMLNKQLGTVNEHIASIEDEVSKMNAADDTSAENDSTTEVVSTTPSEATETTASNTEGTTAQYVTADATKTQVEITEETTEAQDESKKLSVIEPASASQLTEAEETVSLQETDSIDDEFDARRAQFTAENDARIESRKADQKQRMSEMFARIQKLEQQQLEQYKANQDKHIERLREQNAFQQQIIDALILRSEESVKMREANIQRHQSNREQMLNRI